MTQMTKVKRRNLLGKPPILVSAADYDRLTGLAEAGIDRYPQAAQELLSELDRAHIVPASKLLPEVIRMGSAVAFRDEVTGNIQRVTLVYPNEADIASGRISVLTPVGAALIGLKTGQTIAWETPTGQKRTLTVLEVTPP